MDRSAMRPGYASRDICQLVEDAGDDEGEDENAVSGDQSVMLDP